MSVVRNTVLSPVATSVVLFGDEPWSVQAAIARSVTTHKRTSVRACTASGKTWWAARLVVWWLMRYEDAVVLTTATTWPQVEAQLWGEVRKLLKRVGKALGLPEPTLTKLELGPGRYAIGVSPKAEETIGGYHEGHVLLVLDEASGLRAVIHEGVEGPMSGGHAVLLEQGNPLNTSGEFYKHQTQQRDLYNCMRIAAWDTPNFKPLRDMARAQEVSRSDFDAWAVATMLELPEHVVESWIVYDKLTNPLWVKGRCKAWGIGHPKFDARILAEFPQYSDFALIPLSKIEAAEREPPSWSITDDTEAGVDVAGPGQDETAVSFRRGGSFYPVRGKVCHAYDAADARGDVMDLLVEAATKHKLRRIKYDNIGIGHYFGLQLAEVLEPLGVKCVPVGWSEKANNEEQFDSLKSEMCWSFAERVREEQVVGMSDSMMAAQASTIEYDHGGSRGRVRILPAKGDSPDRFVSAVLAFEEPRFAMPVFDGKLIEQPSRVITTKRF